MDPRVPLLRAAEAEPPVPALPGGTVRGQCRGQSDVVWRHRGLLQVCIVTPGAAHFTRARMAELEAAGEDPGLSVSGSTTRVCYSSHPSLTEVGPCTVLCTFTLPYCTVLYCRWRPWCATSGPTS